MNRIPSIELQLFKWISLVEAGEIPDYVELKRAGTRVWIKHARQRLAGLLGDTVPVLTLSSIQLNRRRGFIELQHANLYRPSKAWRARQGWSPDHALAAQHQTGRAHVRPLWDDPDAITDFIARQKEIHQ